MSHFHAIIELFVHGMLLTFNRPISMRSWSSKNTFVMRKIFFQLFDKTTCFQKLIILSDWLDRISNCICVRSLQLTVSSMPHYWIEVNNSPFLIWSPTEIFFRYYKHYTYAMSKCFTLTIIFGVHIVHIYFLTASYLLVYLLKKIIMKL